LLNKTQKNGSDKGRGLKEAAKEAVKKTVKVYFLLRRNLSLRNLILRDLILRDLILLGNFNR
jgi:hypothetical protein